MISVCILSAAWRRFEVTRLVLEQRQQLCVELAARGVDATGLIVADDENLELAREHDCETLEVPNKPFGTKWNLGPLRAAEIADYVAWIGSDDWIHPDVFDPLPQLAAAGMTRIVHGRRLQIVDLATGRMCQIDSPSKYGAVPWLVDSRLLRTRPPLQPQLQRGLDGALIRGIRLARVPFLWHFHDPHEFRCVDFKTSDSLTPYRGLAKHLAVGDETADPWPALAQWFPHELVERARLLSERERKGDAG